LSVLQPARSASAASENALDTRTIYFPFDWGC
jgi:hypothetical protein